jgi:hypothetical protein
MVWRNKAYHDGFIPNALSISAFVNLISHIHFSAWSTKSTTTEQVWIKPDPHCFKINYDTAIRSNFSVQAAVCRDSSGPIIHCFTRIGPPCPLVYGKATAALLAAHLCSSLKLSHVTFEGDSLLVTLAIINPEITQDWRISSIILDFTTTIHSSTSWSARHINRYTNFYAYHVVK